MNIWNYRKPIIVLICVLFATAGLITYQVGIVHETQPLPLDLAVQEFFFGLRGPVTNPILIAITHLSDTVTIVVFCAILLILPTRKHYGLPLSLAALGGVAIYKPMKHMFLRARPDQALHLIQQGGYSFPSGHSVTSVVFYGLAIYLVRRYVKNETLKNVLTGIFTFLAVIIGPSRIFVGVHWPTDVAAGWCIGGAVLLISILVLEWRRAVKEYRI